MNDPVVRLAHLPWDAPSPGLRVKSVSAAGKRLRLVEFAMEFEETAWCARGHTGFVVSGAFELEIGGTTVVLRAGDAIAIPSGEAARHRHRATLETATLFLVEDDS